MKLQQYDPPHKFLYNKIRKRTNRKANFTYKVVGNMPTIIITDK